MVNPAWLRGSNGKTRAGSERPGSSRIRVLKLLEDAPELKSFKHLNGWEVAACHHVDVVHAGEIQKAVAAKIGLQHTTRVEFGNRVAHLGEDAATGPQNQFSGVPRKASTRLEFDDTIIAEAVVVLAIR